MSGIDVFIAAWLIISVLTAIGVTYDAFRNQSAIIPIMKVAWGLIPPRACPRSRRWSLFRLPC